MSTWDNADSVHGGNKGGEDIGKKGSYRGNALFKNIPGKSLPSSQIEC